MVGLFNLGGCSDALRSSSGEEGRAERDGQGAAARSDEESPGDSPGAEESSGDGSDSDSTSGPQSGAGDSPGSEGASGQGASDACAAELFGSTSAPLRRLTSAEYRNTVSSLFAGVELPEVELLADDRVGGFLNSAAGQPGSPVAVERYFAAATVIADSAAVSVDAWAPCTAETAACLSDIALQVGFKSYRRPLSEEESARLEAFAEEAFLSNGFDDGVRMVIEVLLESPYFLYRPEFGGETAVGDAVALSDYEMASRLSYFFLEDMPDQRLFDAAAAGELVDEAGVRTQAERLMNQARARGVLSGFMGEWVRAYQLDTVDLDWETFPDFDEAMRADMRASVEMYVDHALWEADSWQWLMASTQGFVNDRLAPIFGVEPPGSDELVLVDLDPAERRGLLTQPGVLTSTSHGIGHSPIMRGVTMLSNVLCSPVPAPPPGILDNIDEEMSSDDDDVCTTRDYVSLTHTVGADCQGCHAAIDGAGFVFENYDALGRYRTEENGCAVDATGSFPTSDFGPEVNDAIELSEALANSPQVATCLSEHLFRYSLGRGTSRADACELQALGEQLGSGDSLQELILELVTTPSFRSRPGRN